MATSYSITQQKIEAATAACIERKRNAGKFLGLITFTPRRAFEGPCRNEAQQLYGAELAAAQAEDSRGEQAINDALISQLAGGNRNMMILAAVFVFFLIITIIVI